MVRISSLVHVALKLYLLRGVDVVASYNVATDGYGDVAFNLGYNYGKNEVTDIIDPPAELQGAGFDQDNLFSGNELRRFEVSTPRNKYIIRSYNINTARFTVNCV